MHLTRLINRSHAAAHQRGGVLAGCLIALGLLVVIAIVAVVIVAMYWKGWVAARTVAITREGITESALPDSEKPEMIAIVEDFATRYKDGDISMEEFFVTLGEVMVSNLFPIGSAYAADNGYVQLSGLSDEEKADGSVQLMRIAQGLHEGTIARSDFEAVFAPMIDTSQDARIDGIPDQEPVELLIFRAPSAVTDDELRTVIASARQLADENEITTEPVMVDLSDELQAQIDEALGEGTSSAPQGDEAPSGDEDQSGSEEASEEPAPAQG